MKTRVLLIGAAALAIAIAGCGDDNLQTLNQLPDTSVIAESPYDIEGGRAVRFELAGEDPDGSVVAFEWRVLIDMTSAASQPWTRTVDAELVLKFADGESMENRVFQARSIDNAGGDDPTPASVEFSPISLAPEVIIDYPDAAPSITCRSVPLAPRMGWSARDRDARGEAVSTRYILLSTGTGSCLTQLQFQLANPFYDIASDDPRWSDWVTYELAEDRPNPSASVRLENLVLGENYLFAVQARGADGALTKSFDWDRNVRHFQTSENLFPLLAVNSNVLGVRSFVGTNNFVSVEVLGGQELTFELSGSADSYGSGIDGYRWGQDVVDPADPNDPGWGTPFGLGGGFQSVSFSYSQGTHNFVVQVRDDNGAITQAVYQLQVVQAPPYETRRDILLVDDFPSDQAMFLEAEWDAAWQDLLTSVAPGFDPSQDVIDTQAQPNELNLAKLLEYKTVIWFVSPSSQTFLATRLSPPSLLTPANNWLEAYQRIAGNLLLVGPGALLGSVSNITSNFRQPTLYDVPSAPPFGFGVELAGGILTNRGRRFWPYSGFCLEATDFVRPAAGLIFGELAGPLNIARSSGCDAMLRGGVSNEFLLANPGAGALVTDLRPTDARRNLEPGYFAQFEEFYNVNVTVRQVTLEVRDCFTPMFVLKSRRDEGEVDPSLCPQPGLPSPLQDVPVGFMSTLFSDSKPVVGSADFVWGFHPLSFESNDIAASLRWIIGDNWQLPVNP